MFRYGDSAFSFQTDRQTAPIICKSSPSSSYHYHHQSLKQDGWLVQFAEIQTRESRLVGWVPITLHRFSANTSANTNINTSANTNTNTNTSANTNTMTNIHLSKDTFEWQIDWGKFILGITWMRIQAICTRVSTERLLLPLPPTPMYENLYIWTEKLFVHFNAGKRVGGGPELHNVTDTADISV